MPLASRSRTLLVSLCVAAPLAAFAAPKSISKCDAITESGSYVVTKNLAATGDCLVIQADFVTLDLDGFVLTGNGTGAGVAESLSVGRRGITVRNGVITGFQGAVVLSHSSAVVVEHVNATGNTFDAIVAGDMASVKNNTVVGNGGMGIRLGQRALATGNAVNENVGNGIFVDLGGNVAGNTVGRNQASGIVASEGALLVNNVSRNNGSNGIVVDCPSAVISNTTSNNLADNLHLISGACDPNSQTCCVVTGHNSTL
jgi:hypothetical protein